jgi:predicted nucleic-acid-binding Zn-ribbon protein
MSLLPCNSEALQKIIVQVQKIPSEGKNLFKVFNVQNNTYLLVQEVYSGIRNPII